MDYTKKEAKGYARKNMHGLWGSIPYPFTKNLDLNEKGLRSDLRHYIDVLDVDGFYMGGIINEFWALTVEERKRAQEVLIREAGCLRDIHLENAEVSVVERSESIPRMLAHGARVDFQTR